MPRNRHRDNQAFGYPWHTLKDADHFLVDNKSAASIHESFRRARAVDGVKGSIEVKMIRCVQQVIYHGVQGEEFIHQKSIAAAPNNPGEATLVVIPSWQDLPDGEYWVDNKIDPMDLSPMVGALLIEPFRPNKRDGTFTIQWRRDGTSGVAFAGYIDSRTALPNAGPWVEREEWLEMQSNPAAHLFGG